MSIERRHDGTKFHFSGLHVTRNGHVWIELESTELPSIGDGLLYIHQPDYWRVCNAWDGSKGQGVDIIGKSESSFYGVPGLEEIENATPEQMKISASLNLPEFSKSVWYRFADDEDFRIEFLVSTPPVFIPSFDKTR